MSYLGGFHVRTSQLQTPKEKDLMESDQECGERWQGLLARYNQDTRSWKTPQCSLLEDLTPYSETYPRWGTMRNGALYQQPILEQTIDESESGLLQSGRWATPDANMGKRGYQKPDNLHKTTHQITVNDLAMYRYGEKKLNPQLCEWLMGWPLEWTGLKPLEMDKFHKWQLLHGVC